MVSFLPVCLLWLGFAVASPIATALASIPYIAQSLWLVRVVKPSFKMLCVMQSVSLLLVALTLTLQIFRVL